MTYNLNKGIKTITVSGQDNVEADLTEDTVSLIAGDGIVLTTSAAGDSVTITASGGGGGGGGSSNFHMGVAGRAKITSSNSSRLYVHAFGMSVDGDWSSYRTDAGTTDTSFTASTADSIAYYRVGSVPVGCSLTKISLTCYHPATTNAHQLGIWRGALNSDGSTSDITWTLIGDKVSPYTSGNGSGTAIWKTVQTVSSSNSFSASDWVGLTWNTGGNYSSSYVYFDVSLLFEED